MTSTVRKLISSLRRQWRAPVQILSQVPTGEKRLRRAASLGFSPKVIYDCGAFIGRWARDVHEIFPGANFVLIEPNHNIHDQIRTHTSAFQDRAALFGCALSDKKGKTALNVWDNKKHGNPTTALAASSLQSHVQGDPVRQIEAPLDTVDGIVNETGLNPDLLKLDLQGHELPALRGAETTLTSCEMVVVEFGCLDAYVDRTTVFDLFNFLCPRGFVLYDIVDIRYRPYDGALTGGDFFFVKTNSALKQHKDYF